MEEISINGMIQSYVILSEEQIKTIRELFDISEREDISHTIQVIVEEYIKEHTKEDVKKMQADNAWDNFTNKLKEGWFDNRNKEE